MLPVSGKHDSLDAIHLEYFKNRLNETQKEINIIIADVATDILSVNDARQAVCYLMEEEHLFKHRIREIKTKGE